MIRDDFTDEVRRTLANRAGNACSNPDCCASTSGPQIDSAKALNAGVGAHITAAAEGGPRYDPALSSEQRRSADNGIWLCQTCAKIIDNDATRFPEKLLRAWKEIAENRALNTIGKAIPPATESEAQRKFRAILLWKGKTIKLTQMNTGRAVLSSGPSQGSSFPELLDCTEFYVVVGKTGIDSWSRSISLENVGISFDAARECLELQERYV